MGCTNERTTSTVVVVSRPGADLGLDRTGHSSEALLRDLVVGVSGVSGAQLQESRCDYFLHEAVSITRSSTFLIQNFTIGLRRRRLTDHVALGARAVLEKVGVERANELVDLAHDRLSDRTVGGGQNEAAHARDHGGLSAFVSLIVVFQLESWDVLGGVLRG